MVPSGGIEKRRRESSAAAIAQTAGRNMARRKSTLNATLLRKRVTDRIKLKVSIPMMTMAYPPMPMRGIRISTRAIERTASNMFTHME